MAINLVVAKTQFLEGVVALPLSGDGGAVVEEAEDKEAVHEGEVGLDHFDGSRGLEERRRAWSCEGTSI